MKKFKNVKTTYEVMYKQQVGEDITDTLTHRYVTQRKLSDARSQAETLGKKHNNIPEIWIVKVQKINSHVEYVKKGKTNAV